MKSTLPARAFGDVRLTTVGLGASRERGDESPEIVREAIGLGCNVFVTAPHYHQGAHERAVGDGVRVAIDAGACVRDDVFVATHVGRIPELVARNVDALGYGQVKELIEREYVARGLFTWDELAHGDHSIAPQWVRHGVQQSVVALGLSHVDCALLDTPEQQLRVVAKPTYLKRVYAAFEALESLCASGQLRSYGVATASTATEVTELVELARAVAGDAHKLRALAVPLSLLRQDMRGVAERGAELGLHVLATGCLDGGTPGYQIDGELAAELGLVSDATIAVRWVRSAPGVGTAVFATRDSRHLRSNLAAAQLPELGPAYYAAPSE